MSYADDFLTDLEAAAVRLKVDQALVAERVDRTRREHHGVAGQTAIDARHDRNAALAAVLGELIRQAAVGHAGCRRGDRCQTCPPLRTAVAYLLAAARFDAELRGQ